MSSRGRPEAAAFEDQRQDTRGDPRQHITKRDLGQQIGLDKTLNSIDALTVSPVQGRLGGHELHAAALKCSEAMPNPASPTKVAAVGTKPNPTINPRAEMR